ncbi:Hypothetical predicted protein [Mytilus galloprovincialis]|uniref:Uncharacterized protein n=1 Tax=Mytilus galloprovincialis TaxID=29158 RepID=A0A8B6D801_MYTGA|nr:Hypothetical predicted protein [Mytilus galloprovincialis]
MSSKLFTALVLVCVFWLENTNAWWGRDNTYVVNNTDHSIRVSLAYGGHAYRRTVGAGSYTKIETGKGWLTLCVENDVCRRERTDTSFIVESYGDSVRLFKSVYGDIYEKDW